MNVTYGGTPTSVGSSLAVSEPIDGYWSAAVGLLPVVMNTVAGAWLGMVWYRERTTVSLSATAAVFGRCSLQRTPAAFVLISWKAPRMPSGASGLVSHMSMVAGPPASQTRMTLLAFALGLSVPFSFALASAARKDGSDRPSRPAAPTWRKSRRWNPSQSVRGMADSS